FAGFDVPTGVLFSKEGFMIDLPGLIGAIDPTLLSISFLDKDITRYPFRIKLSSKFIIVKVSNNPPIDIPEKDERLKVLGAEYMNKYLYPYNKNSPRSVRYNFSSPKSPIVTRARGLELRFAE